MSRCVTSSSAGAGSTNARRGLLIGLGDIVDTCADGWAQAENIAAALEPASPSVPTSAADK